MNTTEHTQLRQYGYDARKAILEMCNRTRTGHVGSAFSVVEILITLFHRIAQGSVSDPLRDRVILSKGHACAALFTVLGQIGWIPAERLARYATNGCDLGHHPHYEPEIGLDANTGSLGHGLPIGCGLAFSAMRTNNPSQTYVILSDGEMNEGSVWESAAFAAHHHLDNLCVVLDANGMQALGMTKSILDPISHEKKWKAFGWDVISLDGHDLLALDAALSAPRVTGQPRAIVAHTVKGKGVGFMEGQLLWHYRPPSDDELVAALKDLQCV